MTELQEDDLFASHPMRYVLAMMWSVYVELSLATEEIARVMDALDELVPASGCITPRGKQHEIYFAVEGDSENDARASATRYADAVLEQARIAERYTLELRPQPPR